ncbi:MAG TPA: hypothetical protein VHL34_06225 [Rhizomicrobium sp.]|nr:hypothetical protein [Rhizomicrobium sp.]
MAQKPNQLIAGFQPRLEWLANNLDPNPAYRRFISDGNDILTALEQAVERGEFFVGETKSIPGRRQWQNALRDDRPSPIFLKWLYALFPDLLPAHFEAPTLAEFLHIGAEIQANRERWRPAIRYFAEHRTELAITAKEYYREVDESAELNFGGIMFPLLAQRGWIRRVPLRLDEASEAQYLKFPEPGRSFKRLCLDGLKGDYVAYKGALAYATRKVVRPEPQHNGEIFCAKHVLQDDFGFVGFSYYLARYFSYINTCELLGAELADWVVSHRDNDSPPPLSFRGKPSAAFDLENRAAYPGVNCLTIFLNYSERKSLIGRGNYFLLHKRDETQLQAQNTVHIVPSGGHQGWAKGARAEDTAIWRTMMREFAEELFDMEDLAKQPETWGDFQRHKDVARIKETFFGAINPAARAYLHGFGLDPITLKPEVLVSIVVDWEAAKKRWPDVRLKFNWELQSQDGTTRHQWERLSKDNLIVQARGGIQTIGSRDDTFLGTLPAGAACMMEVARHYEYLGLPAG